MGDLPALDLPPYPHLKAEALVGDSWNLRQTLFLVKGKK